jgi:hypothetical protein
LKEGGREGGREGERGTEVLGWLLGFEGIGYYNVLWGFEEFPVPCPTGYVVQVWGVTELRRGPVSEKGSEVRLRLVTTKRFDVRDNQMCRNISTYGGMCPKVDTHKDG